jgi:hypothetical protein
MAVSRQCNKCGSPIPEGRLKVIPDATLCAPCLESIGDIEIPVGLMIYNHKTAPTLFITTKQHLINTNRADRRGYKRAGKDA